MSENKPLQLCPLIPKQLSKFSKLKNQKLPLQIQKPKISLKSQNVRKLTPPNMPILILKQLLKFSKLKNDPLKSKNLK